MSGTCDLCGSEVHQDELFTFTSRNTVVHYTCFRRKAMKTSRLEPNQMKVILDSLEDELNDVVSYKRRASNLLEEARKTLGRAEKDAEKNAVLLTRLAEKFSGVLE